MVDRIRDACRKNGISITKLEMSLGFGNGTIGKWRTAKTSPSIEKVQMVADALSVSVDYLLTGKENKTAHVDGLTDNQKEAVEIIMSMTDAQLRAFIAAARGMMEG